jgi:protein SCO1/2
VRRPAHALAAVCSALAALALHACGAVPATDLVPLPVGGDIELSQSEGRTFRLADHSAEVKLVFFGYASCPDACPRALGRVRQVEALLGAERERLLSVFVSVDPERDTPEHLAEWIGFFGVRGVGVTGSAERIAAIAKTYGASYEKAASDSAMGYLIDHSTYLYLVDRGGRVRRIIRSEDPPEQIARWVKALLAERA